MRPYNTVWRQALALLELHDLGFQFIVICVTNGRYFVLTVQAHKLLVQPLNDRPLAARLYCAAVKGRLLPQQCIFAQPVVVERIGLDSPPELPRTKVGTRKDRSHYGEVLTDATRLRLERDCAREIELLGYNW